MERRKKAIERSRNKLTTIRVNEALHDVCLAHYRTSNWKAEWRKEPHGTFADLVEELLKTYRDENKL